MMPLHTGQGSSRSANRRPLQKGTVVKTADCGQAQRSSRVDDKILERIQKCLSRAHHPNSSELEAKAALFISQKLMSQHNVTQADLMAADGNSDKASFGGRSKVRITKTDRSTKRVMMEAFTSKLAQAMCTSFDCKCYSTHGGDFVEWSFFGITSNTVAAAMAFEMAHNRILDWACSYKGGTPTFSYRIGVADGLAAMAYREKQRELDQARRKELDFLASQKREVATTIQRETQRLQLPSGQFATAVDDQCPDRGIRNNARDVDPCIGEDDSEDFELKADFNTDDMERTDLCGDVNESIDMFVKRELGEPRRANDVPAFQPVSAADVKAEFVASSSPAASPWVSGAQLVQFRATAEQVADDYLTEHKIELSECKKRHSVIRDLDVYRQGQKDSSKIEISRNRQD
ncbi:hypothetical protein N7520_010245 [Penicillium odoratum]|uniref:uncharacterized protein n=1 Tax=Penicillium odoratum TaxID=1167516 RepID=UPI002548585F|nr:uncharacterized protein N7520_010245 [Penicillium odoratum]KAJ5745063.1 hypothetical protein N7520_010245 [Penicillium odoratum]